MPALPIDLYDQSSKLLNKLKSYYVKEVEAPPLISPRTALLASLTFTVLYVAPFYLSATLRSSTLASRDSPTVIRARTRSVALSCLASAVLNVLLLATYGHADGLDVLRLWGVYPISLIDTGKVFGLVCLLFIGPLFKSLIADGEWRSLVPSALKVELWDSWTGYRNLIVGPVSEEFVFRSLVISLFLLAKVSPVRMVFVTPLIFGVAHLHHLTTNIRTHTPAGQCLPPAGIILQCVAVSLFQLTYTSLFGFFAAFAFLRTGNLLAVTLVHTFCNAMGVPQFWGRVGRDAIVTSQAVLDDRDEDGTQGKKTDDSDDHSPMRAGVDAGLLGQEGGDSAREADDKAKVLDAGGLGVKWTVAYYVLLVGGAYGFYRQLWAWTEGGNALAVF